MSALSLLTQFAAEEKTGIAVLGIDPKAILLQAGTFLLLFLILKRFALTKIVSTLEDRRARIEEGLQMASDMEQRSAESQAEMEKLLHKARTEADEIIAKGHEEAGAVREAAEIEARKRAEGIMEEAEARNEQHVKDARKALKREMLGLVAEANEILIGKKLDPKADQQLIEQSLKEQG